MPTVHDIDEVINSGDYSLAIEEAIPFQKGEQMAYTVVAGGVVQVDGSIPCTIQLDLPMRLRGRVVKARLVPLKRSRTQVLMGLGVVGIA